MGGLNAGDVVLLISSLAILVLFIALIVSLVHCFSKHSNRLDTIEKELDDINNQLKGNSN